MNIKPTEEYLQACRQVLGFDDDVEMTPAIVIGAIRGGFEPAIRERFIEILGARRDTVREQPE